MAVMTPSVPERRRTSSVPVSIVPRRSARAGPAIRLSPGLTCGHRRGASVASGLADPEAYDQIVLTNPDFGKRLPDRCAMNEADRASCFGGTAQG
jgi:hypothetical protein